MTARTLALIAIALWGLTLAAGAVLYFGGSSTPSADGRVTVGLNAGEREFVLRQMRAMLANVQGIVGGLAGDDPGQVVRAARAMGQAAMNPSPALMVKLPQAFRQMSMTLHNGFDALADEAEGGASARALLQRLEAQLGTCVGCHAAFRLDSAGNP